MWCGFISSSRLRLILKITGDKKPPFGIKKSSMDNPSAMTGVVISHAYLSYPFVPNFDGCTDNVGLQKI